MITDGLLRLISPSNKVFSYEKAPSASPMRKSAFVNMSQKCLAVSASQIEVLPSRKGRLKRIINRILKDRGEITTTKYY